MKEIVSQTEKKERIIMPVITANTRHCTLTSRTDSCSSDSAKDFIAGLSTRLEKST